MPSKLQTYMQMADEAQRQITGSYRGWTGFLTTAARLYKYPYAEQVMIHAQRPDATACAEYDFWNEKMGRYVRRGSKGIALIDSSGERPRLRYVFDVSDTGGREFPKSRYLWEYRAEHADAVPFSLSAPPLKFLAAFKAEFCAGHNFLATLRTSSDEFITTLWAELALCYGLAARRTNHSVILHYSGYFFSTLQAEFCILRKRSATLGTLII